MPGHDKGSLSYTPILLLEPQNYLGVPDFEDNLFGDKIFDQTSSCLILVKCVHFKEFQ